MVLLKQQTLPAQFVNLAISKQSLDHEKHPADSYFCSVLLQCIEANEPKIANHNYF